MISRKLCDEDEDEEEGKCLVQMFVEPYSEYSEVGGLAHVRRETVPQLCCPGIK